MNIVIAGGGTGGHLYPCLALAEMFIQRAAGVKILFIGTRNGIEARVVPERGFSLATIWAKGIVGKSLVQKIIGLFYLFVGMLQSFVHLLRFAPCLVIGIGGYIAGPVLIAAFFLRMKRVILEPNYRPGAMNAVLAPFVHLTITAFRDTAKQLRARRVACLGVPVRSDILAAAHGACPSTDLKTVLIIGGSQGAHAINRGIVEALPFLSKKPIRIIHQVGARDFDFVQEAYAPYRLDAQVMRFIDRIADVYAVSHLVIARAGAGTLSELAAVGLPALLIPFPHALGHQEKNATPFVAAGAAEMILENEWAAQNGEVVAQRIWALLSDSEKLKKMRDAAKGLGHPQAAADIVSACVQLVGGKTR